LIAVREGLRELGYVEGRTIALEVRWAEGRYERFPALVADLVHDKVDVLVVATTPGALAAKNATTTIPVVMVAVGDPVGIGLVASLARPDGNLTGAEPPESGTPRETLGAAEGGPSQDFSCGHPHKPRKSNPCGVLEGDAGCAAQTLALRASACRGARP